jgi:hypothetical protein
MARPTIPAGYEAITSAKALQTLEKLVTQNNDFDFFEEKYKCTTYFGIYDFGIIIRINLTLESLAVERTNNTQASQQHARTNQTTLHKQNTCKRNSSTADIASAAVSASAASASTNLRARKRGKRAGVDLRQDQRDSHSPIRSHTTHLRQNQKSERLCQCEKEDKKKGEGITRHDGNATQLTGRRRCSVRRTISHQLLPAHVIRCSRPLDRPRRWVYITQVRKRRRRTRREHTPGSSLRCRFFLRSSSCCTLRRSF